MDDTKIQHIMRELIKDNSEESFISKDIILFKKACLACLRSETRRRFNHGSANSFIEELIIMLYLIGIPFREDVLCLYAAVYGYYLGSDASLRLNIKPDVKIFTGNIGVGRLYSIASEYCQQNMDRLKVPIDIQACTNILSYIGRSNVFAINSLHLSTTLRGYYNLKRESKEIFNNKDGINIPAIPVPSGAESVLDYWRDDDDE